MCPTLPQAAILALWRGQVVEAIKLVRVEQNIGLKEAKEHVEAYVDTEPALRSRLVQAHADAREGFTSVGDLLSRWWCRVLFFFLA